jgi:hypothetical protein
MRTPWILSSKRSRVTQTAWEIGCSSPGGLVLALSGADWPFGFRESITARHTTSGIDPLKNILYTVLPPEDVGRARVARNRTSLTPVSSATRVWHCATVCSHEAAFALLGRVGLRHPHRYLPTWPLRAGYIEMHVPNRQPVHVCVVAGLDRERVTTAGNWRTSSVGAGPFNGARACRN